MSTKSDISDQGGRSEVQKVYPTIGLHLGRKIFFRQNLFIPCLGPFFQLRGLFMWYSIWIRTYHIVCRAYYTLISDKSTLSMFISPGVLLMPFPSSCACMASNSGQGLRRRLNCLISISNCLASSVRNVFWACF